jgi:hypothetical protein
LYPFHIDFLLDWPYTLNIIPNQTAKSSVFDRCGGSKFKVQIR